MTSLQSSRGVSCVRYFLICLEDDYVEDDYITHYIVAICAHSGRRYEAYLYHLACLGLVHQMNISIG